MVTFSPDQRLIGTCLVLVAGIGRGCRSSRLGRRSFLGGTTLFSFSRVEGFWRADRKSLWKTMPDVPSPRLWWNINDAVNLLATSESVMTSKRQNGKCPRPSLKPLLCWDSKMRSNSSSCISETYRSFRLMNVTVASRLMLGSRAKYGRGESSSTTMADITECFSMTTANALKMMSFKETAALVVQW